MQEFTDAIGMNLIDLINYRENPLDKMDMLIQNNIHVIMVCEDLYDVVPYYVNGQILEDYYRKNNVNIVVFKSKILVIIPMCLLIMHL